MAGTHTIATVAMALLATTAMAGAAAAVTAPGATGPTASTHDVRPVSSDSALRPVTPGSDVRAVTSNADVDPEPVDGTPVADRRAATSRSVAEDAPGDEPVLLVHGFLDTGYTPWWEVTEAHLADHGYDEDDVYKLNLGAIPGSTVDSPADYGHAVCDAVQRLAARYDGEVDIIAHSMGGLDARYCVEKLDGAPYVDDLVTLGTPHQGTYAAYLAYVTPGGRAMVPGSDFLTDLNDGQLAEGVSYTAVYSSLDQLVNPDGYARLPAAERESVDDAVNVHSGYQFHLQLAWDGDVVAQYVDRLD